MFFRKRKASWHKVKSSFLIAKNRYKEIRRKKLNEENTLKEPYDRLQKWQEAITVSKNFDDAHEQYSWFESRAPEYLQRPMWRVSLANFVGILLAIAFAICLRQMWLEHQKIPSGSMRSTLLELDHVLVSKTAYGINNPLSPKPLAFDPSLLRRGDLVTFTGENIPGIDSDTPFLGFIPTKRRLVKRLMALSLDRVYFYGGKVWTLDPQGNIRSNLDYPYSLPNYEYIPFQSPGGFVFNGKLKTDGTPVHLFNHFRQNVLAVLQPERGVFTYLNPQTTEPTSQELYEHWGIGNYAQVRLLKRRQYFYSIAPSKHLSNEPWILELSHHPRARPTSCATPAYNEPLYLERTLLPLTQEAVTHLKKGLYTSRFVVKEGRAFRYDIENRHIDHGFDLLVSDVPDGTYEMAEGIVYSIRFDGQREQVPSSHPLYEEKHLALLFNCGIDWDKEFKAMASPSPRLTRRFCYWNEGNIMCMGRVIYPKDHPTLQRFIDAEKDRQKNNPDYIPFSDEGAPDASRIARTGLHVPEGTVLVLGDNHSLSADSRAYGPIPMTNIQGRPIVKIWPPSSFLQGLQQTPAPWLNRYTLLVYGLVLAMIFIAIAYNKRQYTQKF